jgi:hypothetical protein
VIATNGPQIAVGLGKAVCFVIPSVMARKRLTASTNCVHMEKKAATISFSEDYIVIVYIMKDYLCPWLLVFK